MDNRLNPDNQTETVARLRACIHRLAIIADWSDLYAPSTHWCPDAIENFAKEDLDRFIELVLDDETIKSINGDAWAVRQVIKVKP